MTQIRPTQIKAALLCDAVRPVSYVRLEQKLSTLFAGKLSVRLGQCQDGAAGSVMIGPHHILVSQINQPLPAARFHKAMQSAIMQRRYPGTAHAVASHRAAVCITLGGPDILLQSHLRTATAARLPSTLDPAPTAASTPDIALFAQRVHVARLVTEVVADMVRADLIHWSPSDQIFTRDTFAYGLDTRGMAVQIHPWLFSDGPDPQGRQKEGYHALGAEHVTGHHVIVEQTILNLETIIPAINDLIHGIQKDGQLPRHGSTVQMKSGVELLVHLLPADARHPRPYLSVAVVTVGNAQPPARPAARAMTRRQTPPALPRRSAGSGALHRIAGLAALSDGRLRQVRRFVPLLAGLAIYLVASQVAPGLSLTAML